MEKNIDIMKPCYSENILPVPWPLVMLTFHCIDVLTLYAPISTYKFSILTFIHFLKKMVELKDARDTCFLRNKAIEAIGWLLACLVTL